MVSASELVTYVHLSFVFRVLSAFYLLQDGNAQVSELLSRFQKVSGRRIYHQFLPSKVSHPTLTA